jgi:hypothetical protein
MGVISISKSLFKLITHTGKLDVGSIITTGGRYCMNPLAFRAFAYKSLKNKPLTTALTFCIQTAP